jgi:hypothetical protein
MQEFVRSGQSRKRYLYINTWAIKDETYNVLTQIGLTSGWDSF